MIFSRAIDRLLEEQPQQKIEFTLTTTTLFEDAATKIQTEWQEFGTKAVEACEQSSSIQDKSVCPNLAITVNLRIVNFPRYNKF